MAWMDEQQGRREWLQVSYEVRVEECKFCDEVNLVN